MFPLKSNLMIQTRSIWCCFYLNVCEEALLTCVCVCFQRSRSVCGSAVAVWRSFPAAESATSSESSIRTPSQGAVGPCSPGNTPQSLTLLIISTIHTCCRNSHTQTVLTYVHFELFECIELSRWPTCSPDSVSSVCCVTITTFCWVIYSTQINCNNFSRQFYSTDCSMVL